MNQLTNGDELLRVAARTDKTVVDDDVSSLNDIILENRQANLEYANVTLQTRLHLLTKASFLPNALLLSKAGFISDIRFVNWLPFCPT